MGNQSIERQKELMSDVKYRGYIENAKTLKFLRKNPCLASEYLLGIKLLDTQKYIIANSWSSEVAVWSCCRNFGKSFLIAVFAILTAVLYENQNIYIISSVGDQAKETFKKIEQIVNRMGQAAASIATLKDLISREIVVSPNNKDGFSHMPSGYTVSFYNGSRITTLNSRVDSNRGKRATLLIYDEAAFCDEDLIIATKPFVSQDSEFKTSVDNSFDISLEPPAIPNKIIFASSQDTTDTAFYKQYRESAKYMLAGDRRHFVADMPADVALNTVIDGKPHIPLIKETEIKEAMKTDKQKALREYYNVPMVDGGVNQIIKRGMIRRNERLIIPYADWRPENKIVMAFDPARTLDNSILGVMNLVHDPELGLCGDIINFVNFIDIAHERKYKLDSNRQLALIRDYLLRYNGDNPDYEYIDKLLIDAGSGGGGVSTYADQLLNNWTDKNGKEHKGLIDAEDPIYSGYRSRYKEAIDKLLLISPRKYRTQMVEEFIELFSLGVIRMPYEYNGAEEIMIPAGVDKNGEEIMKPHIYTEEEIISLSQIDKMKDELVAIHKTTNAEKTSVTYSLAKEKENKMHDDRFYVMILLAHRLYELRRAQNIKRRKSSFESSYNWGVRAPQLLS